MLLDSLPRCMMGGMDDSKALTRAWREMQASLPGGWKLDSLRCASTGLSSEQRSDDWIAVVTGPNGEERSYRSSDPLAALAGLGAVVDST